MLPYNQSLLYLIEIKSMDLQIDDPFYTNPFKLDTKSKSKKKTPPVYIKSINFAFMVILSTLKTDIQLNFYLYSFDWIAGISLSNDLSLNTVNAHHFPN